MGYPYGKRLLFSFTKTESHTRNLNYFDLGDGQTRKDGAFRVVEVDGLWNNGPPGPQPIINIYEYTNIRFASTPAPARKMLRKLNHIANNKYVAISHVWDDAPEVMNEMNEMAESELLHIDVQGPDGTLATKTLSWPGLIQMAHAVRRRGADYFWLDLPCIDQIDRDKSDLDYAICIMSDIYEFASGVVVMIGGAGCVQRFDKLTGWMDRAWTLQEAILNKDTYVCLKWPKTNLDIIHGANTWSFDSIPLLNTMFPDTTYDYCLVKLHDLLDLSDAKPSTLPAAVRKVRVLDGMVLKARNAPRLALRAAIVRPTSNIYRQIRYTGVWRSMYMRTSSKPRDVVYSIMGIFKITIDPFRKARDPAYLFRDLARKTAAKWNVGPAWLTIGGIRGSDIPHDPKSRIIPKFPHAEKAGEKSNDKPPQMAFGGRFEWAGYHVDHSPFFIKEFKPFSNFDIKIMTHSHPHLVNASMLRVKWEGRLSPVRVGRMGTYPVKKKHAYIRIGGRRGPCVYDGSLSGRVYAVFVGTVGDMRDYGVDLKPSTRSYRTQKYFLFFKWNKPKKYWHIVANGVWEPPSPTWEPSSSNRYIFNVGEHAQERLWRWPVDDPLWVELDVRGRRLHRSYGIELLPDWRRKDPEDRSIKWFGSQYQYPPVAPRFKPVHVRFKLDDIRDDEEKLVNMLRGGKLRVVSCAAPVESAPRTSTTRTTVELIQDGAMNVVYSYGGWSKAVCAELSKYNFDGLLIRETPRGLPRIWYYVRILFGEKVMYLQMKKHRNTLHPYHNVYAIPYQNPDRRRNVRNAAYIQPGYIPQPQPYIPQPTSAPYIPQTAGWGPSGQETEYQRNMRWQSLGYIPAGEYQQWAHSQGLPGDRGYIPPGA
ncbi:hypothetical protein EJ04DRAFT_571876 [Polyplosphaeria fusca]|uniref:Heterokaryon incompatibility domain-containing protein n=1 Tax=Polyplosphaeria fusca TaxID=682080 RepID=A0A9P4RAI3_9PLEO|nr:hypothetical protein EJ04DRAFT_571876 [Polyplosphaeria fusca]